MMKTNKPSFFGIMLIMLASGLIFAGCSDVMMDQPVNQIPSDLRNTTWARQISDSETVTISFERRIDRKV